VMSHIVPASSGDNSLAELGRVDYEGPTPAQCVIGLVLWYETMHMQTAG
jgi:hypothetical protein